MIQPERPTSRVLPLIVGALGGEALGVIAALHFNLPFHDRPYFNAPIGFVGGGIVGAAIGAATNYFTFRE